MKYIITEQQLDKIYDSYLDYAFKGLYEVRSKKYLNSRFWKIEDENALELENSGRICVKWGIWESFSGMFSLNYNETQQIMKKWLEEHLNLEGITPVPLKKIIVD